MNAPFEGAVSRVVQNPTSPITIDDKYTLARGRAYMSGIQALVKLPMMQKLRDAAEGWHTAGYISGYRGSPLAALDLNLWKAKKHLAEHSIHFHPGVNEDLAATAIWGTQQIGFSPNATQDGVFAMWYGKGPGVDRSGDAFKHANMAGCAAHGGVLVLAGDDHGCRSSTMPHQSDPILAAFGMPTLYPATPQEYLDFGLHGWAMSRYTGLWVALKCVTDIVESSASVDVDPQRVQVRLPSDFNLPDGGLNIRWPDSSMEQEARMMAHKWPAAIAYARANQLDKLIFNPPVAKLGILSAGKAYLDLRQALKDLGLDDDACAQLGIRLLKIGCIWPLDQQGLRDFSTGLEEIFVAEEKRPLLEAGLKESLYNVSQRPRIFGKTDNPMLAIAGELSPAILSQALAQWLSPRLPNHLNILVQARLAALTAQKLTMPAVVVSERAPWFCSGCPHNTSTKLPSGSRAIAGTGCHYMANWMDRNTSTITQMGSEGINWLGQRHFIDEPHIFVNLGDGTYFHSGLLAIRAAIADRANMTYKLLYNDAVAMTGGQPVEGTLTVKQMTEQVLAEGAAQVVIVSDEPEKYELESNRVPKEVNVYYRDRLDEIQRALREVPGVTILIYDQACATERRRKRKRGLMIDPAKRAYIHHEICEGCGDCSNQSNCLSIEPLDTELGNKRQINQSSCNKDFSCVKGFCPSFVTLQGAQLRAPERQTTVSAFLPAEPALPTLSPTQNYSILVTGVGGTGVITIGALLGMAAHLDGKGISVLDVTGLAQKGGAVASHIQITPQPDANQAARISAASANVLIGCDAIVSIGTEALSVLHSGSHAVVNTAPTPTAAMMHQPNWQFPSNACEQTLKRIVGEQCEFFDANAIAKAAMGDTIYANPIMLGYAWQKGWLPLTLASLLQAIELNGVAITQNHMAFGWGRRAAHNIIETRTALGLIQAQILKLDTPIARQQTLEHLIDNRASRLENYQNKAYAQCYRDTLKEILARDVQLTRTDLSLIVAKQLYRLMAIKDEYEVARLFCLPSFREDLRKQFAGEPGRDYQIHFHLAPPTLNKSGQTPRKMQFGAWMMMIFRLLARLKFLRGSMFDLFGYHAERRQERALLAEYIALLNEISAYINADNYALALDLAALPEQVRGFGHVRTANLEKIKPQWHTLLQRWRQGKTACVAA